MYKDPIVEEVRAIRRRIEAEHGQTWESFAKHLLKVQEKYKDRLVELPPHQPKPEQPKKAG